MRLLWVARMHHKQRQSMLPKWMYSNHRSPLEQSWVPHQWQNMSKWSRRTCWPWSHHFELCSWASGSVWRRVGPAVWTLLEHLEQESKLCNQDGKKFSLLTLDRAHSTAQTRSQHDWGTDLWEGQLESTPVPCRTFWNDKLRSIILWQRILIQIWWLNLWRLETTKVGQQIAVWLWGIIRIHSLNIQSNPNREKVFWQARLFCFLLERKQATHHRERYISICVICFEFLLMKTVWYLMVRK